MGQNISTLKKTFNNPTKINIASVHRSAIMVLVSNTGDRELQYMAVEYLIKSYVSEDPNYLYNIKKYSSMFEFITNSEFISRQDVYNIIEKIKILQTEKTPKIQ